MPSTWAFTFSWAVVATVVLIWLQDTHAPGYRTWQYLDLGAIFARTLLALIHHQLLPHTPKATSAAPADVASEPAAREEQLVKKLRVEVCAEALGTVRSSGFAGRLVSAVE